ncbi:hypothetical protein HFO56_03285 [Rhizobium laguerreae]|uniref:hypothetical protein n=1 Tax=Rhizobium laguerreae TaxID=1076926 RepID=UPI001C920B5A|nr:hypothetical protein [Rhizobium laguerreae]MBY3151411.1 hypothetical protein [Rhizobium laguerreae]
MLHKYAPLGYEFGLNDAVACLNKYRDDKALLPCVQKLCESSIRSFDKLEDALAPIVSPLGWNVDNLLFENPGGRKAIRKPRVCVFFKVDTFSARRGNMELWLYSDPDSPDFRINVNKSKLLRVDDFAEVCEMIGDRDHYRHMNREASSRAIEATCDLFEYIIQRLECSFEVKTANKLVVTKEADIIRSYELVEEDHQAIENLLFWGRRGGLPTSYP